MKIQDSRIIIFAILLFSLVIRIPALFIPHIENDEVIYQTLADKVSKNFFDYSLRGTSILDNLSKRDYDHPLFQRPPLFVYTLALFRNLLGSKWGILLPILSGVFTILALFGVVKELYNEKLAVISALIMSFCPLLLFCSVRILIDSLLVLLLTVTIWFFLIALRKRKKILFAAAGILFGLTVLTKEAGIFVFFICFYFLFKEGVNKEKIISLICFLCFFVLIVAPWYYYCYKIVEANPPWWTRAFPGDIEMFPFVKMVAERPWYFYFQNITLSMPVYVLAWVSIVVNLKKKRMITEILWAFLFLVLMTIYGIMGNGYQTRYILPAIPALAILSADIVNHKNKFIWIIGIILVGVGFLTGILNFLISKPADIFPLFYFF